MSGCQAAIAPASASIGGAIDFQAVAAGLAIEVEFGETVERFLDRGPAVDVVHVVVDDEVMLLLRLARRWRQRQRQDKAILGEKPGG